MKNYLYFLLAQKSFFWKMKNSIFKYIFALKVTIFSTKTKIKAHKDNYELLQSIFKITQSSMFIALFSAIVLQLTNYIFKPYVGYIKNFIDQKLLISLIGVNSSDYVTFLVIIATIGGCIYWFTLRRYDNTKWYII